jgi:glycopeptide antibiotics resistance protein
MGNTNFTFVVFAVIAIFVPFGYLIYHLWRDRNRLHAENQDLRLQLQIPMNTYVHRSMVRQNDDITLSVSYKLGKYNELLRDS